MFQHMLLIIFLLSAYYVSSLLFPSFPPWSQKISHLKAHIIKLEKPYQSLSTPNDPSFLLLVSDLRSEISHLCPIISSQCTITSSFKLPTQPTLTSSSSKSSSQPTFSSTSSYCSNQSTTSFASTNHPILSTFSSTSSFFSTLSPTTSSTFNSLLQCPNFLMLSPSTSHSSFSQSSACSIKPSVNFACPTPLSSFSQLTSSNSIKIFYFNARSILPMLDELSGLSSTLILSVLWNLLTFAILILLCLITYHSIVIITAMVVVLLYL